MINCPKCGANIKEGDRYCHVCGTKIVNLEPNLVSDKPVVDSPVETQEELNDDPLIDAYIGENVEEIKKEGFSFCYFFFGDYYAFYRNMWSLVVLLIIISCIADLILPSLSSYIALPIHIYISSQFKSIYLKNVKKQVNKIKSKYPNASQNDLINICRKKGGTSIITVIVIIVLFIASYTFFSFYGVE